MTAKVKSPRREQNLAAALDAAAAGCPVFPCNHETKAPFVKWKEEATTDPDKIRKHWKKFPNAIPALVTGAASGFVVVDLDVKNGKDGVTAYRELGLDPSDAGAVVRTASGGLHLYFRHAEGVRNAVDKLAPGIDVRGDGGYVIAPGAVGHMGGYAFLEGDLEVARMLAVPLPDEFRPHEIARGIDAQLLSDACPETIRSALFYIPNDQNYDDWVRILMALHHAFGGAQEGLKLAQEWSAGYKGYNPDEVRRKWLSFEAGRGNGVTVASLFAEARDHGWTGQPVAASIPFSDWIHPAIEELNARFALVRLGTKNAVAEFKPGGDIEFIATSAFRELFLNRRHGNKTLGNAWMMHSKRRTYEGGVTFWPDGRVVPDTLNLWTGFSMKPNPEAGCDLIIDHIKTVIAAGNDEHAAYILSWLAHIVQKPAEKPDVALVLKGKKGVGKDTLAEVMKAIVGRRHYAHVPATERLTGRFNAAFATAILIHVEEAIWGGHRESKGVVQSLITCPEMPLERKNIDTVQVDSFCRLLFTTNEAWAIPATADERRYAVFEVSAIRRGDREYFSKLWHEINHGGCEAFLAYLLMWKQPKHIDLRNPPRTRGLMEQELSGLRGVERWWYEVLADGEFGAQDCDFEDSDQGEYKSWAEATLAVRRDALRRAYEEWMTQRRYQGEIAGPPEFGETLRAMCPEITSTRPAESGVRKWKYVLPPLDICRQTFSSYMGGDDEISWPD